MSDHMVCCSTSSQTTSTLMTFALAMVLYPDVQRRAQAEIDSVIGGDRLPTFEDRASLPYIESILRETLRWHPIVPLGNLPHCVVFTLLKVVLEAFHMSPRVMIHTMVILFRKVCCFCRVNEYFVILYIRNSRHIQHMVR